VTRPINRAVFIRQKLAKVREYPGSGIGEILSIYQKNGVHSVL